MPLKTLELECMMSDIAPLVVTPEPLNDESLMGFLLRTSELNGYATPNWMLKYSGMTDNEMKSISLPLHKLTKIFGRKANAFDNLSYVPKNNNPYGKRFFLNGHELNAKDIKVKNPKICPECIKENNQTTVFWELGHAAVCPTHKKELISSCPTCNKSLTWFRRGLLRCSKGCDLSKTAGRNVTSGKLIALSHILENKLLNKPYNSSIVDKFHFPMDAIEHMSMKTLSTIITKLSNYKSKSKKPLQGIGALIITADVLCDFPNGFYSYLKDCGPSNKENSGYRKQYDKFYTSFFKTDTTNIDELKFLYDAFFEFGTDHWKKGIISMKLNEEVHKKSNIVGISHLAKELGTNISTIQRLVEMGRIVPTKVSSDTSSRNVFEITEDLPRRIEQGKSFTSREAAKFIGLPDSVLKQLRDSGVFKFKYLGNKINSFHEFDLIAFKDHVLSFVDADHALSLNKKCHISLDEIMKMKLGGTMYKTDFINSFLQGEAQALASISDNLSGIVFDRASVKLYLKEKKVKTNHERLAVDVAKLLKCDSTIIASLISQGYLKGEKVKNRLLIDEESLLGFANNYVICSRIAHHINTSTNKILEMYKKTDNKPLSFSRKNSNKSNQAFIPRAHLGIFGIKQNNIPLFHTET